MAVIWLVRLPPLPPVTMRAHKGTRRPSTYIPIPPPAPHPVPRAPESRRPSGLRINPFSWEGTLGLAGARQGRSFFSKETEARASERRSHAQLRSLLLVERSKSRSLTTIWSVARLNRGVPMNCTCAHRVAGECDGQGEPPVLLRAALTERTRTVRRPIGHRLATQFLRERARRGDVVHRALERDVEPRAAGVIAERRSGGTTGRGRGPVTMTGNASRPGGHVEQVRAHP